MVAGLHLWHIWISRFFLLNLFAATKFYQGLACNVPIILVNELKATSVQGARIFIFLMFSGHLALRQSSKMQEAAISSDHPLLFFFFQFQRKHQIYIRFRLVSAFSKFSLLVQQFVHSWSAAHYFQSSCTCSFWKRKAFPAEILILC